MTDELFSVPEQLSPKEAWKRKHQITTTLKADAPYDTQWRACCPSIMTICHGPTEAEAFDNLVSHMVKLGFKDWKMW